MQAYQHVTQLDNVVIESPSYVDIGIYSRAAAIYIRKVLKMLVDIFVVLGHWTTTNFEKKWLRSYEKFFSHGSERQSESTSVLLVCSCFAR